MKNVSAVYLSNCYYSTMRKNYISNLKSMHQYFDCLLCDYVD